MQINQESGEAVWDITGTLPEELRDAIVSHLKHNCDLTVDGPFQLAGEPVQFYGAALLCQLVLRPGCTVGRGRKRTELTSAATFYFLFRAVDEDEVLIPLTGGEGDILLAKRWLGLSLRDDAQRLDYARFYCAFARTGKPADFHNVPRNVSEIRFATRVEERQIWGIYGAMWRFLVDPKTLAVRVHFEPRGSFWRARHRTHVPMQWGKELLDVDLKIWDRDGHISYNQTGLIYRDEALAEETSPRVDAIDMPRYVSRGEWLLTVYRNFRTAINQAAYLAVFSLFLVASAVALALPLDLWGFGLLRWLLDSFAGVVGIADWTAWLRAASLYCIAYFALTTLIVLDVETFRNALLAWSPRFKRSRVNELLYALVVKRRRLEGNHTRGLVRRVRAAMSWLIIWTGYLVCAFTSLQTSLRPELASNSRALKDVMQVFGEQALLYVPVVFYYVGRKSLDPEKVGLVSTWVLVLLQLVMGLLVIRRIHRYWASTSAARLNERVVERPPAAAGARAPATAPAT